mmetsp:Transcript_20946/g.85379  ORF Transcript_20946/g.85379 Transcript_20946/m.85379 type:complete len:85 (-) Transcript_20946:509-763(-)
MEHQRGFVCVCYFFPGRDRLPKEIRTESIIVGKKDEEAGLDPFEQPVSLSDLMPVPLLSMALSGGEKLPISSCNYLKYSSEPRK